MGNFRDSALVWADLAETIQAWEEEYGVALVAELHTFQARGRPDLYAEIKAYDRSLDSGEPLHTLRQPLNIRKTGAPLRNLLYGMYSCLEQIDSSPWTWPVKLRRERVQLD